MVAETYAVIPLYPQTVFEQDFRGGIPLRVSLKHALLTGEIRPLPLLPPFPSGLNSPEAIVGIFHLESGQSG